MIKNNYLYSFVGIPVLACAVLLAQTMTAVHAQPVSQVETFEIKLPAQPLATALAALSKQTGVQVYAAGELVAGKKSAAITGRLSASEALSRLLVGSGLEARTGAGGGFVVQRAASAAKGEQQLPEVQVAATANKDPVTEGSGSYAAKGVTIGKATLSPREIPQSVSVLTRQRINDQNLTQLEDALDQITGLQWDTNTGIGSANIVARGFPVTSYQYDGVPQTFLGTSFTGTDLALYDRVEVIRGSSGLLQGSGNPSATVNLVRKKPTHEFAASTTVSAGSWNFLRGEVDVGGPLNETGTLRGRFVGVYEDRDYYVDTVKSKKNILYGVLEYDITSATTFTAGLVQQQVNANPAVFGLPRYSDGRSLDLPVSASLTPAWNRWSQDITEVFFNLSHVLENDWKLNLAFNSAPQEQDFKRTVTRGTAANFGVNPANPAASIYTGVLWQSEGDRYSVDANATGQATLFGRKHDLLIGVGAQDYVSKTRQSAFLPAVAIPNVFTFDPYSVVEPPSGPFTAGTTLKSREYGLYGSGRFSLADPLKLILGARLSQYQSQTDSHNYVANTTTFGRKVTYDHQLTPYAGIVYDINRNYSAYASYSDVFLPQTAQYQANGDELDPIVGSNYEIGIKSDLFNGALQASLAVFRIDQENRAQEDLNNPCATAVIPGACYVAEGKVRSEGFETEVSGKLASNWDLFAGYTFNETEYLQDRVNQGRPFRTQTPKHLFKLWTQYRLPGGWSVGGGVNAQSSYYAMNGAVRSEQEAVAILKMRIAYQFSKKVTAALNINNLTDEKYYSAIRGVEFGNVYGEPRNAVFSVKMDY